MKINQVLPLWHLGSPPLCFDNTVLGQQSYRNKFMWLSANMNLICYMVRQDSLWSQRIKNLEPMQFTHLTIFLHTVWCNAKTTNVFCSELHLSGRRHGSVLSISNENHTRAWPLHKVRRRIWKVIILWNVICLIFGLLACVCVFDIRISIPPQGKYTHRCAIGFPLEVRVK